MKVEGKPELSEDEAKKPEVSYYFDADKENFFCKVECTYDGEHYPIELNDFGIIKGQKNRKRNEYFEKRQSNICAASLFLMKKLSSRNATRKILR